MCAGTIKKGSSMFNVLTGHGVNMEEVLGWMSPEARVHVEAICRFKTVHADRLQVATPDGPCISELPTVI